MQEIVIESFGYRHRDPNQEVVIDCRILRNPHRRKDLRYMNGLDEQVKRDVLGTPRADSLLGYAEAVSSRHEIVGVGCHSGKHRSVVIAEELGRRLREKGHRVIVRHLEKNHW